MMPNIPIVISESTTEPITLDEAAANLRLVVNNDSPPVYPEAARVLKLITAARQACEIELGISLVAKVLEIGQASFYPLGVNPSSFYSIYPYYCGIELPLGPVRSIVSVTYVDSTGLDAVLATDQYRLNAYVSPAVLLPVYGVAWPAARFDTNSVRVRYTVGYPSTDSPPQTVPEKWLQAMHLLIAHWFANREAVDANTLAELSRGVSSLLWLDRKGMGV